MLLRVNEGLGNIFSLRWLLYGEGEMLADNNINIERTHTHAQETQGTNNDDRVAELESRVAELQSKVEMLEYIIETQKRLIKEIDQKRDKSVSANVHSA
jgi:TolA-binding protein